MPTEKLDFAGQVEQMKSKGITFKLMNEKQAMEFLRDDTYYFRLKFYAGNYDKHRDGPKKGKYIDLDFAYLKELSLLDVYFRRAMFPIVIDIEHYTKVSLLNAVNKNKREDGYSIVQDLFTKQKWLKREILHQKTPYTEGLVNKYGENFGVWNIVEVLTFTNLISLYDLYFSKYQQKHVETEHLYAVRSIRNSIAHNNCLLQNLRAGEPPELEHKQDIYSAVASIPAIGDSMRKNKLAVPVLYDLVATLEVFDKMVTSQKERIKQIELLYSLISTRFTRHIDYFDNNPVVSSAIDFMLKVVSHYRRKALNGISCEDVNIF